MFDYLKVMGYDRRDYADAVERPENGGRALVDGKYLAGETLLEPGVRLGRLKDFLYRMQIERAITDSKRDTGLISNRLGEWGSLVVAKDGLAARLESFSEEFDVFLWGQETIFIVVMGPDDH